MITDFFAQFADMYINGTIAHHHIVSPDLAEDHFTREDPSWFGHQQREQFEFLLRHLQFFTGSGNLVFFVVDGDFAEVIGRSCFGCTSLPAQQSLHTTQQDAWFNGFRNVIVGTGVETTFEVTVRLTVERHRQISWPRGETADDIFTTGNARPLDQALQHATTEMLDWLRTDFGLDDVAAAHLLGQVVRYDVANVYDPAYTMACRIAKKWLPAGSQR